MEFPTQWVAGGGFVALLSFGLYLLIHLVRLLGDQEASLRADIVAAKLAFELCERRTQILVEAVQRSGIPIPPEYWEVGNDR